MNELELAAIAAAKVALQGVKSSLEMRQAAAVAAGQGDLADDLGARLDNLTTILELLDTVDLS